MDDISEKPSMVKEHSDVEMDETQVTDKETIDAAQLAMTSRTQQPEQTSDEAEVSRLM